MHQAAVARTGRKDGLTSPMPTLISRSTLAVRTCISIAVAAIRAVRAGIKVTVSTFRAIQVGSSQSSQEANLAALSPGSRAGHRKAGVLTLIWVPWMIGIAHDVTRAVVKSGQGESCADMIITIHVSRGPSSAKHTTAKLHESAI